MTEEEKGVSRRLLEILSGEIGDSVLFAARLLSELEPERIWEFHKGESSPSFDLCVGTSYRETGGWKIGKARFDAFNRMMYQMKRSISLENPSGLSQVELLGKDFEGHLVSFGRATYSQLLMWEKGEIIHSTDGKRLQVWPNFN